MSLRYSGAIWSCSSSTKLSILSSNSTVVSLIDYFPGRKIQRNGIHFFFVMCSFWCSTFSFFLQVSESSLLLIKTTCSFVMIWNLGHHYGKSCGRSCFVASVRTLCSTALIVLCTLVGATRMFISAIMSTPSPFQLEENSPILSKHSLGI